MGTRSVVARPMGDGFEGRYVHWDGYPTGVGAALLRGSQQLGTAALRKLLVEDEKVGWSSLCNADFTLPPCWIDGAIDDAPHGPTSYSARGETGDLLVTQDSEDSGTEWCYVIADECLSVFERAYPDGTHMTGWFGVGSDEAGWALRGTVKWDDPNALGILTNIEDRVPVGTPNVIHLVARNTSGNRWRIETTCARGDDAESIAKSCRRIHRRRTLVVGPLEMNATEGERQAALQAAVARVPKRA